MNHVFPKIIAVLVALPLAFGSQVAFAGNTAPQTDGYKEYYDNAYQITSNLCRPDPTAVGIMLMNPASPQYREELKLIWRSMKDSVNFTFGDVDICNVPDLLNTNIPMTRLTPEVAGLLSSPGYKKALQECFGNSSFQKNLFQDGLVLTSAVSKGLALYGLPSAGVLLAQKFKSVRTLSGIANTLNYLLLFSGLGAMAGTELHGVGVGTMVGASIGTSAWALFLKQQLSAYRNTALLIASPVILGYAFYQMRKSTCHLPDTINNLQNQNDKDTVENLQKQLELDEQTIMVAQKRLDELAKQPSDSQSQLTIEILQANIHDLNDEVRVIKEKLAILRAKPQSPQASQR